MRHVVWIYKYQLYLQLLCPINIKYGEVSLLRNNDKFIKIMFPQKYVKAVLYLETFCFDINYFFISIFIIFSYRLKRFVDSFEHILYIREEKWLFNIIYAICNIYQFT